MPKVTIGLPTFNRALTLERTIAYILNQTFSDFEVLIYDDGSTDDTFISAKKFTDSRISFYSFPNQGPPAPLNFILDNAQGEYIIFLHDHDHFREDLLEKCVDSLDTNPTVGFVLPGGITISENQNIIQDPEKPPHEFQYVNDGNLFLHKSLEAKSFESKFHACSMVRATSMQLIGNKYETKYGFYSDVELWLRLLNSFDFIYIDDVLIQFTAREDDHILNGNEILMMNSLYEIHFDIVQKFFSNSSNEYIKSLQKRYFNDVLWTVINIVSNKRPNRTEQMNQIEINYVNNRLKFFTLQVLKSSIGLKFLPILKRLYKYTIHKLIVFKSAISR